MIKKFEKNSFTIVESFGEEAVERYIQNHNDFENIHVRLALIQNLGKHIFEYLNPVVDKQIFTGEAIVKYKVRLYAFTEKQFEETINIISKEAIKKFKDHKTIQDSQETNTILNLEDRYNSLEEETSNLYNEVNDLEQTIIELHETINRLQDAN